MSDIRICEKFRPMLEDPMVAFVVVLKRYNPSPERADKDAIYGAHVVRHQDAQGFMNNTTIGLLTEAECGDFIHDLIVGWSDHEVWSQTVMAEASPEIQTYLRSQILPLEWKTVADEYVHPRVVLLHPTPELTLRFSEAENLAARLAVARAHRAGLEEVPKLDKEQVEAQLSEMEVFSREAASASFAADDAEFLTRLAKLSKADLGVTKTMAGRMIAVLFATIDSQPKEMALEVLDAIESDLLEGEAVSFMMRQRLMEKRAQFGVEKLSLMEYNRQTELAFDAAIDQTTDVDQLDPKDQVSALIKVREQVANLSRALEGLEGRIRRQAMLRREQAKGETEGGKIYASSFGFEDEITDADVVLDENDDEN